MQAEFQYVLRFADLWISVGLGETRGCHATYRRLWWGAKFAWNASCSWCDTGRYKRSWYWHFCPSLDLETDTKLTGRGLYSDLRQVHSAQLLQPKCIWRMLDQHHQTSWACSRVQEYPRAHWKAWGHTFVLMSRCTYVSTVYRHLSLHTLHMRKYVWVCYTIIYILRGLWPRLWLWHVCDDFQKECRQGYSAHLCIAFKKSENFKALNALNCNSLCFSRPIACENVHVFLVLEQKTLSKRKKCCFSWFIA